MGALTQIYVDPAINANSGTGTIEDPYGDLQYALTTHTRDATHGNQINIKNAEPEYLAAVLDFATNWGAPTSIAPTIIRGYQTTKNDGGKAIIDGGGGACIPSTDNLHFRDIEFRNGGAATIVNLGSACSVIDCRISNTTGIGIALAGSFSHVFGNEITDCDVGISSVSGASYVRNNYLKFGSTRNFSTAIRHASGSAYVFSRNIISVGSSGTGISIEQIRGEFSSNSIFAAGSNGSGIAFDIATRGNSSAIFNNVVEGFSGEGGSGFNFATATSVPTRYAGNAAFGNDVDYRNPGDIGIADGEDNEVLTASPFAKTGADTFANRFAYFSPVDTGNIRGGAMQ